MRQVTAIDTQTRRLIKALEPTLRRHLGAASVETQFVTGLYWRLRQSLADCGGFGSRSSRRGAMDLERLALDVYLTAATYLEGSEATPALLSSARRDIERVLAECLDDRDTAQDAKEGESS